MYIHTDTHYSICLFYGHLIGYSYLPSSLVELNFICLTDFLSSFAHSGTYFLISFVHIFELVIWWTFNSWCSTYATLRTQISVCLYQLEIPKSWLGPSWNFEMHFETKVCLSSLLLWKKSPEEPGLTPECFSSLLEGGLFSPLLCLPHCSLYNCLLWFPDRPLW